MGIEKYFMAIFLRRGTLPRNHTLSDLMKEASSFLIIEPDLAETLRFMDSLQRICSIDDYSIETPSESDVPRFLSALDAVARLAERELSLAGLPN
jgi:HEPN domain-containing protein